MLEALQAARADLVIACQPNSPRAIPPEQIAAAARTIPVMTEVVHGVAEALQRAVAVASEEDAVVATGSLYVAGEARAALRSSLGELG
jgi:dihydrofolate synthase/folylpolyglutamate synthase